MMIVMRETATDEEVEAVVRKIERAGARAHSSRGERVTVIGAIGDVEQDVSIESLGLEGLPGVDRVVPILKPYKLASAQFTHGERTVLDIDGRKVGGESFALIAGPCTVESRDQTLQTARIVRDAGATLFRGGAYKPRTSPYAFQGLGAEGVRLAAEAQAAPGVPRGTRPDGGADPDEALAPASDRRPQPRGRAPRAGAADVPRGCRRGSGRHHRRDAPEPRGGCVRRPAGASRGRLRGVRGRRRAGCDAGGQGAQRRLMGDRPRRGASTRPADPRGRTP